MPRGKIRIGCGAGCSDDRIPPGAEIVENGELNDLAMECLADRTIAREARDRAKDPSKGYTPVRRHELPRLRALNFVIENALGGGVTRSLAIDPHGKILSAWMLTIELPGHNKG